MDVILEVTVLFTLSLALSFLIERIIEILKAYYYLLDSRRDWYKFWTKKTYKIRNALENKLRVIEFVGKKSTTNVLRKFEEKMLNVEESYSGTVPVLSGDLVRAVYIRTATKFISIIVGIGLAFWMKIDLIDIFQNAMSDTSYWIVNIKSDELRIGLSGVVIGLGTSSLHKVISTVEKKSEKKKLETI